MGAPKGNEFWKLRSSHGRKPKFESPDQIWDACCEYFKWVEENPLWESKVFTYQGDVVEATLPKMRAMTLQGLQLFLGISNDCWISYRNNKDFSEIVETVEKVVYSQKFSGAAADLLNSNIIARDLGLRDNKELSGPDGGPVSIGVTVEFVSGEGSDS